MNERTDWTNRKTERMYIALFFPKALKTVQIIINIYTDGQTNRRTGKMDGQTGWRDGDGLNEQRD